MFRALDLDLTFFEQGSSINLNVGLAEGLCVSDCRVVVSSKVLVVPDADGDAPEGELVRTDQTDELSLRVDPDGKPAKTILVATRTAVYSGESVEVFFCIEGCQL